MPRWTDGYVADVTYTANVYRDITPAWLAFATVMFGHRPPDLAAPMRVAELGCGHGLTAAVIAACHPSAEVHGFDFNPAHIESARLMADGAGLGNLHFEERSFADLAEANDLPQFDIVTLHGVYSWVAPENRRRIVTFLDRALRPGGLAYVSYNVATGWASMEPVRALMRMLAATGRGRSDAQVPAIAAMLERMRDAGAAYFAGNPSVEPRLKMLTTLDPKYVAHEYLNADWHPQMSADVAAEMAEAKLAYIGSATLTDNIDAASAPTAFLPILAEQTDPRLRETLRDFGSAQSFRRDVFRRGANPMGASEHMALLDDVALVALGPPGEEEIKFPSSIGQVIGRREIYAPLLERLSHGPLSLREARAMPQFAGSAVTELLQAATLLVSGGYAHPLLPAVDGDAGEAALAAGRRLNVVIARMNADGGAIAHLCAPLAGTAIPADLVETLAVGEILAGRPAEREQITDTVAAALARTGRHVQADGKPVIDAAEARRVISTAVEAALGPRAPLHRRLGILT